MAPTNNNKVPVKAVQLFIDNMNKVFEQNKAAIDQCSTNLKDLTKTLTETLNILNQNPSNEDLDRVLEEAKDRLEDIINETPSNEELGRLISTNTNKLSSMITIVKTVTIVLVSCVGIAIFGSQLLFSWNADKIVDKIEKETKIEESVTKTSVEKKVDKILEKMDEAD